MTENLALIMAIKTDTMNLSWSLYSLIPLSLCKKMNYYKLTGLYYFFCSGEKMRIFSLYDSLCLQSMMDNWVQSNSIY